jgi:hypothetical protein
MSLAVFKQRPETLNEWALVPADERAVMKANANEERDIKSKDIKTGHRRLQQANEYVTDICALVSTSPSIYSLLNAYTDGAAQGYL